MSDSPVGNSATRIELARRQPQMSGAASPALSRRRLLLTGTALGAVASTAPVASALAQTSVREAAHATPPAMRGPATPKLPTVAVANTPGPELPPVAVIAFNRMAFGPRPNDLSAFRKLGKDNSERLEAFVEQQLNPDAIDDSKCDEKLAAAGFTTLDKSLEALWADHHISGENRYDPVRETERATFLRAVYSKRQLLEVLADHWHNHFNIYGWEHRTGPVFVHYDRDVIRKHLLGNFRQMLEAVAKSTAMLYYLDNQSNTSAGPNENWARELFELHSLGAENYFGVRSQDDPEIFDADGNRRGYIDEDVYGATTCFTGWRVNTDTGKFEYDDSRHFPYQKVVLGKIIPANQGIKDGYDVLDLLAHHPGTARHVCRRLCRRLVSDDPPERLVQEAADVFLANKSAPDQLSQVVRTILRAPEFRATWGEKIKRPFEYAVSVLRASNANFEPGDHYFWNYNNAGQRIFGWAPPNGYPDRRDAWSSTMPMLQRWRHVNWLLGWKIGGEGEDKDVLRLRPEKQMPAGLVRPTEIVDFWINRILGRPMPAHEREALVEFMAHGRNPDFEMPAEQIPELLRYMVGLIFMSPSFHWR